MDKYDNIKKPPAQYVENFIVYRPGLDTMPNLREMLQHGLTYAEAERLERLYHIEAMKYHLREPLADDDLSPEEVAELQAYIDCLIAAYNEECSNC